MTLTSKKSLPLLLYILLMLGCTCVPVPGVFAPQVNVPPSTTVAKAENPTTVPSSPTTAGAAAKAEKPSADEEKRLSKDTPCFTGSNKFGGVKYYYRRQNEKSDMFNYLNNEKDNEENLSTGDWYFVKFVPDADCYVYVFQVAETEIFDLVKKSAWSHEKIFKRGRKYSLPSEENEDAFKLQEGNGQETIYFIASKNRDLDLEELYDRFYKASENKEQDQISKLRTELLTQLQEKSIPSFKLTFQHQAPPVVPKKTDENKSVPEIHN